MNVQTLSFFQTIPSNARSSEYERAYYFHVNTNFRFDRILSSTVWNELWKRAHVYVLIFNFPSDFSSYTMPNSLYIDIKIFSLLFRSVHRLSTHFAFSRSMIILLKCECVHLMKNILSFACKLMLWKRLIKSLTWFRRGDDDSA